MLQWLGRRSAFSQPPVPKAVWIFRDTYDLSWADLFSHQCLWGWQHAFVSCYTQTGCFTALIFRGWSHRTASYLHRTSQLSVKECIAGFFCGTWIILYDRSLSKLSSVQLQFFDSWTDCLEYLAIKRPDIQYIQNIINQIEVCKSSGIQFQNHLLWKCIQLDFF